MIIDIFILDYDKKGQLLLVMLENQIIEDIEDENNFKVHFVLFVLGALLCLAMKLFVLLTSYERPTH